uniref:Uncharacterized protein n=1 Tax=Rhizophora mucronata TaxID=61149 RepID=A0A2P2N708_RHIMU
MEKFVFKLKPVICSDDVYLLSTHV